MDRLRAAFLGFAALVGLLAATADAAVINCTAVIYIKGNFDGERYVMRLAPEAETAKNVIIDLAAITQTLNPANTWDDAINSARFFCNCTGAAPANCSDAYTKAAFRIFSEPFWRKHGGGENITMRCDPAPDKASCGSVLQYMPKGWGNRASAVALLYNLPNYSLPMKAPAPQGLPPSSKPTPTPTPTTTPTPSTTASPPPKAKSPPPKAKSPPPKAKPSPKPATKPSSTTPAPAP